MIKIAKSPLRIHNKNYDIYWRGWKNLIPFTYGRKFGRFDDNMGLFVLGPFGFYGFKFCKKVN